MKNKLAGHLPLRDAVTRTIEEAREKMKLAAEECDEKEKKVKKLVDYEKKEHGHLPSVKEEEAEKKSSANIIDPADPEEVEKLASALDAVTEKLADGVVLGGESSQGGTVLPVQSPAAGRQPYKKNSSKSHNSPMSTGLQGVKDAPNTARTATQTDDERAPGGNGAKYPAKGPLKTAGVAALRAEVAKVAFSVTPEGHKADAERSRIRERHSAEMLAHGQKHDAIASKGPKGEYKSPRLGKIFRGYGPHPDEFSGLRHHAYVAKKHEGGKNAYNPFGGTFTPSKYEDKGTAMTWGRSKAKAAGAKTAGFADTAKAFGSKAYGAVKGGAQKAYGAARDLAFKHPAATAGAAGGAAGFAAGRLSKRTNKTVEASADPVAYIMGKISAAQKTAGGADIGGESPQGGETVASYSKVPMQPGRSLIQNKDSIKNVTKKDAKAPRKKELAEVLTEPAFSAAHDSKVNENLTQSNAGSVSKISHDLRSATKGGVKTAAAREFLRKIASEGCQCDGAGTCRYCTMQKVAHAKRAAGSESSATA